VRRLLTLPAEAIHDIEQASSSYHDLSPQISFAFVTDVIEILDQVEEFPEMYQILHRTARRAVLHSFPSSVLYCVLPDAVDVLGVHARGPAPGATTVSVRLRPLTHEPPLLVIEMDDMLIVGPIEA
jgi:hypothetical protein